MLRILTPGTYYGQRQRTRSVRGMTLVENSYPPAFVIPRHAHAAAFFGLVLEGGYRETYDSRCRECDPSSLLFHPAGEVHSETHYDVVVRILSLEPSQGLLTQVEDYTRRVEGPREYRAGPLLRLGARLYREFVSDDALAPLALEGIALELLAAAGRQPAVQAVAPRWLRSVRDVLQDRFRENLGLDEIAELVGVHPAHLARMFRRCHGCTIGDFVRNLRVERARHELTTSDRTLAEIALGLGYADQSHFTSSFKRQTGLTPGAFRRACRAPGRYKAQP
jgi:AraC family transcriptional regulator